MPVSQAITLKPDTMDVCDLLYSQKILIYPTNDKRHVSKHVELNNIIMFVLEGMRSNIKTMSCEKSMSITYFGITVC